MFSLVSCGKSSEDRLYSPGDEIEFSLENGCVFKGTFEKVNDLGQVYFSDLKVKVGRDYKVTEGSLKIGVGDIKEYWKGKGLSSLALLDSSGVLDELISAKGGTRFCVDSEVCLEVKTDYGKRVYRGIYSGIYDGFYVVLRNYVSKDYLNLLSMWRNKTSSGEEIKISIHDVYRMWYPNKSTNRYRIKIIRKRKK